MLINQFNAGLNTRLSPNLISTAESTKAINIDFTKATIKPLKGLTATNKTIPINNNSFTIFKGAYLSSNDGTSYVEFNDTLYIANGIDTVKKTTDGISIYPLGLAKPSTKLSSSTSFNPIFTLSNIASGSTITFPTGTYQYLVQFKATSGAIDYKELSFTYTGTRGVRLTISSMSNILSVTLYRKEDTKYKLIGETTTNNIIDDIVFSLGSKPTTTPYQELLGTRNYIYTYYSSITGFESAPSEASDDLKCMINNVLITNFMSSIDSTVDLIKLYRIGGTLNDYYLVDTFSKNTTNYIDTKSDLQVLEGTILTSQDLIVPPVGIKFLTEYNSALFGAIDSTLYFSNPGVVDNWTSYNYIDFPEHITGLGVTQNGLLIFSRNKTWILTGDSLSTYSKYLLNGNQGCISHSTIAYVGNNLLWLSLDGICTSVGGSIEVLSWPKLSKLSLNPKTAKVYDNQYYLFHSTGCIVVDFREGVRFYELDLVIRGAYYSSDYDMLYLLLPSNIGIYEYGTGSNLNYTLKTGWLSFSGITNYKTFKNIYVMSLGTSSLKVYLDGELVTTTLITNGINDIKLPQTASKGYYLELEFSGTGEIIELDINFEGRQNGR